MDEREPVRARTLAPGALFYTQPEGGHLYRTRRADGQIEGFPVFGLTPRRVKLHPNRTVYVLRVDG